MISPRSFLYINANSQHRPCPRPSHNTSTPPTSLSSSLFSPPSSLASSPSYYSGFSSSISSPSSTCSYQDLSSSSLSSPSYHHSGFRLAGAATTVTTTTNSTTERWPPKYERTSPEIPVPNKPVSSLFDATMGKRKERRETGCLSPSSPPTTTTSLNTRPTTATSPVKIPTYGNRETAHHPQKRHITQRRRVKERHDPNSMSPSLAALLAVTDIPRPRKSQSQRRRRRSGKPLTVDEIIGGQVSEKELSWSLCRSPLEMLLSPPEELFDDDGSVSDCNIGSALMARTLSSDSIPSLGYSYASGPLSSLGSPRSPSPSSRRTRFSPMRKSLEPVISPAGDGHEHPLAVGDIDLDELDFRVFQPPEEEPPKSYLFKPLKSAFKSNLTASLRALRSAAKSFSAINFPSIPPDDFLTRSILTIDPNVPFTDERRPPVSPDIPSAAMRRYLNPTTNARIESRPTTVVAGTFAASIQMRTYKIQRSRSAPSSARSPYPVTSLQMSPAPQEPQPQAANQPAPTMRQREMRENPDFIRIAVMEMAMRKQGKLDDQRPGRARWALPPRKMSTKPYEIAPSGVPVRWVPINA